MKRTITYLSVAAVLIALGSFQAFASPPAVIPTFSITAVVRNTSVTIDAINFPSDDTYIVTMGKYGTLGIGGIQVGMQNTVYGGSFTSTYLIPESLQGLDKIAVRLQSTHTGYYSYNWFWNTDHPSIGDSSSLESQSTPLPFPATPVIKIPTFTIIKVTKNENVTISAANFHPNDTYVVRMGKYGTLGVGGKIAGTYETKDGSSFTKTFKIPAGIRGLDKIAIRFESSKTGYYSYNWFVNINQP
ncbi:MAG: hypothetical protein OEY93_09175 [Anaerolineae bacterium]|nr:hypothetical protein [Anaerolineae bacterium]